ncbi:MAG: hypothetical protein V7739_20210 [Motiliproteus sp.]
MFKRFKFNSAMSRLGEERLYEIVMDELSSGNMRKGLWAKALAKSNGNHEQAKSKYIEFRVESLKDEAHVIRPILDSVEHDQDEQDIAERERENSIERKRERKRERKIERERDRIMQQIYKEEQSSKFDKDFVVGIVLAIIVIVLLISFGFI